MQILTSSHSKKQTSEAVVDGLFGGLIAGTAMLILLIILGWVSGDQILATINRFTVPRQATTPLSSLLLHLGVSGVYGAVFGLLLNLLPNSLTARFPTWLAGMIFGFTIYVFAVLVLLPGTNSPLLEIPSWQFAAAHLVYGAVLGFYIRYTNIQP